MALKSGEEKLCYLKSLEGQIGTARTVIEQGESNIEMWLSSSVESPIN
jgi:hypothetical protein